jgi:hypothetical protein
VPLNTAIFAPICVGFPNNSQLLRTEIRLDIHKKVDSGHRVLSLQNKKVLLVALLNPLILIVISRFFDTRYPELGLNSFAIDYYANLNLTVGELW